jgi:hypothetical protein
MVDSRGNLALDQLLAVHNQRVRVIVLLSEEDTDPDDEMLEPAIEGFRQGWRDAMIGNTIPVEQLWEEIGAVHHSQSSDQEPQCAEEVKAAGTG